MQIPAMQTYTAGKAASYLSRTMNAEVNIDKVYFSFFNKLVAKEVSIVSPTPLGDSDTLLACNTVYVSLKTSDLLAMKIRLNRVILEEGEFNLVSEENGTNLDRIFGSGKKEKKKDGGIPQINVKEVRLDDFRFSLINKLNPKYMAEDGYHIDFSNLKLKDIGISIKDISIAGDTLRASIRHLAAEDISGMKISELSGNVMVCAKEARIDNLILNDEFSHIRAGRYAMKFENSRAFSNFTDSVKLEADFNNTLLDFRTIGKIVPSLRECGLILNLNGKVEGYVRDFRTENLVATMQSGFTTFTIDAAISGLPEMDNTDADISISNSTFTAADISEIISAFSSSDGKERKPPVTDMFSVYGFTGNVYGSLNDFIVNGYISSGTGIARTDINVDFSDRGKGLVLDGKVSTDGVNLGKILNNGKLGYLTMNADLYANFNGRLKNGMSANLRSLHIGRMDFNGYRYSDIAASGKMSEGNISGKITSSDRNLRLSLEGDFMLPDKNNDARFDFYADIAKADLAALKINGKDSISVVNGKILSNFSSTEEGDIIGSISISDLDYTNENGKYSLGPIEYSAVNSGGEKFNSILYAPFIEISYTATAPLSRFIKEFNNRFLNGTLPTIFGRMGENTDIDDSLKNRYKLDITVLNTENVFGALNLDAGISEGSHICVNMSEKDSLSTVSLECEELKFNNIALSGINTKASLDSILRLGFSGKEISINNIPLMNSSLYSEIHDNTVDLQFSFKNDGSGKKAYDSGYGAEISMSTGFEKDSVSNMKLIKAKIMKSDLLLRGSRWEIPESGISYSKERITVDNFSIMNRLQKLNIDGSLSGSGQDTLNLTLDQFDMSLLNLFLSPSLNIKGRMTGKACLSELKNEPKIALNLKGDSVYVAGEPVGYLEIRSKWNTQDNRFDLGATNIIDGKRPLLATGHYTPSSKNINMTANLDSLSAAYFNPFLASVVTDVEGSISGEISLDGPFSELRTRCSNGKINDLSFVLDFTKVPYTLDGPFQISEKGVTFNNITLLDSQNNSGTVNGGITFDFFRDIRLDTRINFSNMHCLGTSEKDNSSFYGTAYGTGMVGIKGSINEMTLDINVTTGPKTSIHIPLSSAAEANRSDLLTFVNGKSEHPAAEKKDEPRKTESQSNLVVNAQLNVNPQAEIQIEINKSLGDILKTNGTGQITMNIDPRRDIFNMFGDYNIDRGNYKFVLLGLASRDFTIQQGGQINFNGDIMNTQLNITAAYRTKASIGTLISDNSSVSGRRNVDCEINMTGALMNPELKFNIDIPDLEPTTKGRVESALSSDDKIQKQFVSVIVSGDFVPDEQSGIVNNSSLLYSNASEILSNQLNNVFRQLDIPIDLGFNYQPGEEKGQDMFDVAISTQLFNNRVIVNGNIGNGQYEKSNSVVGDIDIEIKLEKQGKLRLNIFSHSADQYSNYLDDSQRQGIGIVYQDEFNTFRELFRKFFWSKRRKQEFMIEELRRFMKEERERSSGATSSAE